MRSTWWRHRSICSSHILRHQPAAKHYIFSHRSSTYATEPCAMFFQTCSVLAGVRIALWFRSQSYVLHLVALKKCCPCGIALGQEHDMMEHDRDRMKRSPLACCRLNHVMSSMAFVASTSSLCSNQSRADNQVQTAFSLARLHFYNMFTRIY